MLAGIVILILGTISALVLSAIAFMMTKEAFGIVGALVATAFLGIVGFVISIGYAATIATPIMIIAGLVLFGLAISLMIGAIMGRRGGTTSWPPQQEQSFQTFEQRASGSQSTAWIAALVSGAAVFVFAAGVYFGVAPEEKDIAKTMNMSNLTKKQKTEAPAPAPTPAPDVPKTAPEAPAPAPAPESK